MEFIKQNLVLVGLVVGSALALIVSFLRDGSGKTVSVTDATLLINRQDAVVIDVREAAEFAVGHLPDARHMPQASVAGRLGELESFKDRPLVVCCASGVRSSKVCQQLRQAGFAKAVNLAGGVGSWEQAGLPLVRGKA